MATAVLTSAGNPVPDATNREAHKFEGTWQLVSAIKDAKETPKDVVNTIRVVIKDGRHTVNFKDKIVAKQILFAVDPTQTPKFSTDTLPDGSQAFRT
jgi:uncharacterized protein (TIGR03067 family)